MSSGFRLIIYIFITSIILYIVSALIIKRILKGSVKEFKEGKFWAFHSLGVIYLFSMIICLFISLIVWLFIGNIDTNTEVKLTSEVIEHTEKEIVNLNINSNIEGSLSGFFVGLGAVKGSLSSNEYYYFYVKNDDKYKLEKVKAEDVSIVEYDGVPKIVHTVEELKKVTIITYGKISKKLGIGEDGEVIETINNDDRAKYGYEPYNDTKEETLLYIPKNSITTEFKPNLE